MKQYKVIVNIELPSSFFVLIKQLTLRQGCSISYQRHHCRKGIWTFINGEGKIVLDDERRTVRCWNVIRIPQGNFIHSEQLLSRH
ncbi:hypothetical protein [Bacteroides uniformis]|uniref:hypothetical protein n=1 Tax=Bacteroides uniformis TaxID=820 RepID=UPI0039B60191